MTAAPRPRFVEKHLGAENEIERCIESGLLLPSLPTLAAAEVLLDNMTIDQPPLDPTVVSWTETQIEQDPAFAEFERHFNAVFSFPMLMSRVGTQEYPMAIVTESEYVKST